MNNINIIGNLVRDPELRVTQSGKSVLSFTIAVNEGDSASFFDCTAFEKVAESMSKFTSKGSKVALNGKLKQDSWEDKDGKKRSTVKIVAFSVDFLNSPSGSGDSDERQKPTTGSLPQLQDDEEIPF